MVIVNNDSDKIHDSNDDNDGRRSTYHKTSTDIDNNNNTQHIHVPDRRTENHRHFIIIICGRHIFLGNSSS